MGKFWNQIILMPKVREHERYYLKLVSLYMRTHITFYPDMRQRFSQKWRLKSWFSGLWCHAVTASQDHDLNVLPWQQLFDFTESQVIMKYDVNTNNINGKFQH